MNQTTPFGVPLSADDLKFLDRHIAWRNCVLFSQDNGKLSQYLIDKLKVARILLIGEKPMVDGLSIHMTAVTMPIGRLAAMLPDSDQRRNFFQLYDVALVDYEMLIEEHTMALSKLLTPFYNILFFGSGRGSFMRQNRRSLMLTTHVNTDSRFNELTNFGFDFFGR